MAPDNPLHSQPSDHSVPVCYPHNDPYTRPAREYKVIKFRPLPESGFQKFGDWIVHETWDDLGPCSASAQAINFENILKSNLESCFPLKTKKLSSHDKPFITSELKDIDRKRNREYKRNGKSEKYFHLKEKFELKYKAASKRYLAKSLESLQTSKPGRAYTVLKNLGAQPGDCTDSSSFSLTSHEQENLSPQQCAERIAAHFSLISQEFPPLNTASLSKKVKNKLDSAGNPPLLTDYDVYMKIKSAKKPKSGTPSDIPRELIQEFSPEIATPLAKIYNQMFSSGEWPNHWKLEHVVPIGKVTCPQTEDDLRPISLTPFFSKVAEHFVVGWLLNYVGDKIDHRQYGGLKGNGTTHYLIEFLNFILQHLDDNNQIAVLACFVDFQKAFNRQDHNLLIEKLSDLDVPGWLLRIVVAFLSNRSMVVNYKGCQSSVKPLPGGGPRARFWLCSCF